MLETQEVLSIHELFQSKYEYTQQHSLLMQEVFVVKGLRRTIKPQKKIWYIISHTTIWRQHDQQVSIVKGNKTPTLVNSLKKNTEFQGIPWQSSGQDSVLPLQGAWVQSLVGELRSHMPRSAAKTKNKKKPSLYLRIFILSAFF